jgi:preprotein translocase subunit YajC
MSNFTFADIWTLGLLAQDAVPGPATPPPGGGGTGGALFLPAVMIAMVVFMLLSARSQKKREVREREAMFTRLAKNDRVLTIGGVIGTILMVKDNEVVLKVDETTNTKMTFVKSAIQRILTDAPAGEKS